MREANTDKELDDRIYALGNYWKIMNAAKRRFSALELTRELTNEAAFRS